MRAVPNMAMVCSSLTSCFLCISRTILRWLQLPGITFVFPFLVWCISILKYWHLRIFSASPSITFLSLKLQQYYYYYYYLITIIIIPLQIKPSCFWNGIYNSLGGGSAGLRASTCTCTPHHGFELTVCVGAAYYYYYYYYCHYHHHCSSSSSNER